MCVTGDLVDTVRSLTGSSTYDTERGADGVGTSTLNLDEGPVVVVNWSEVWQLDGPAIERLLAHQAGHVLLYQRGEHTSPHQHLVDNGTDWHLLCIASDAIEEYRIERVSSASDPVGARRFVPLHAAAPGAGGKGAARPAGARWRAVRSALSHLHSHPGWP